VSDLESTTEGDDADWPPPREGRCNAKRPDRTRCWRTAGWGTPYNVGCCRKHGGAHANGRKHAARLTYESAYADSVLFGETVDRDPVIGAPHVASKLAGFALYVEREIARTMDPATGRIQLVEMIPTAGGGQREDVDVRIKLWLDVLDRLLKAYKISSDMRIDEIKLDLVASYQERFLDMIEGIIRALGRDPDDPEVDAIVTRQLALISAAGVVPGTAA
jgi:hypothetical protein